MLPNESPFVPFDPLPADRLNDLIENDQALSDGTGIEDGAIDTRTLAQSAVTGDKLNLGGQSSTNDTLGTTTSTSYTATLTGGGATPSVTLDVPESGQVLLSINAFLSNTVSTNTTRCTFSASGANTIAPSTENALITSGSGLATGRTKLLTGLDPGSTTFQLLYNTAGGTATFAYRNITAIPIG